MKRFIIGTVGILVLIGLSGCGGATAYVSQKVEPNRKPITIDQMAFATSLYPCQEPNNIVGYLGNPNKVSKEGDKTIWTYIMSDKQLSKDVQIKYTIYSSQVASFSPDMSYLPYKDKDILREKYYNYFYKKVSAECDIKHEKYYMRLSSSLSGYKQTRAEREKSEREERESEETINRLEDKVLKYEEKILDLKEQLLKERKILPVWFR